MIDRVRSHLQTVSLINALFQLLGVELGLLSRRVLAILLALNRGGKMVRVVEVVRLRALVDETRPVQVLKQTRSVLCTMNGLLYRTCSARSYS